MLSELDKDGLLAFVTVLSTDELIEILESMPNDDAADLVGRLPEDLSRTVLDRMKREDSEEVGELLKYGTQTAGGIMIPDFIALHEETTTQNAIRIIRSFCNHSDRCIGYFVIFFICKIYFKDLIRSHGSQKNFIIH